MSVYDHPLARHPYAHRIVSHTLLDVGALLAAESRSFSVSLCGDDVTFHGHGDGEGDGDDTVWLARLGDWLVSDGDAWHVVADLPVAEALPA